MTRRKHLQFGDGEIDLAEADRPAFEIFRIAVLWSVGGNLRIHLMETFEGIFDASA